MQTKLDLVLMVRCHNCGAVLRGTTLTVPHEELPQGNLLIEVVERFVNTIEAASDDHGVLQAKLFDFARAHVKDLRSTAAAIMFLLGARSSEYSLLVRELESCGSCGFRS